MSRNGRLAGIVPLMIAVMALAFGCGGGGGVAGLSEEQERELMDTVAAASQAVENAEDASSVEAALRDAVSINARVIQVSVEPADIVRKNASNTFKVGEVEGMIGYMGDRTTTPDGITIIEGTHQPDPSAPNTKPLIIAQKDAPLAGEQFRIQVLYRPDFAAALNQSDTHGP